ncbi:MAG: hypothetical protein RMJ83_10010, partial [Armatimonadota bacterium]|nr:hypothetical protein [Armatimonadota bacterium]
LSEYDAIEARLMQVRLLVETGQFQRAQPVAAALRQVDRRDARRGEVLFWVVRVAMALHDAPTLTRYWRQLRKRFPCPSDPELHFSIHNILPYIEQVDDIVAWREAEVAFARQVGDPLMLGFALGALIEPLMFFGEFTRALRLLDEAHRLYSQLGDALHLHRAHHTQALCYLQLGALEQMQQVLDACSEQEQLLGLSPHYTRWLQVCLWREQGDYTRATELALSEATLQEIEQNWLATAEMLEQAALCFYAQGDLDTALRYCTEARRLAERGVPQGRTLPPSHHYLYLQACAGNPEALRGLEARLHEWRTHNLRPLQATALLYLSEGYALQGDLERARACLQEAIELNQAMGRKRALQKCQNLARKLGSN